MQPFWSWTCLHHNRNTYWAWGGIEKWLPRRSIHKGMVSELVTFFLIFLMEEKCNNSLKELQQMVKRTLHWLCSSFSRTQSSGQWVATRMPHRWGKVQIFGKVCINWSYYWSRKGAKKPGTAFHSVSLNVHFLITLFFQAKFASILYGWGNIWFWWGIFGIKG